MSSGSAAAIDPILGYTSRVEQTPFDLLGGAARVRALVERFYDVMSEREPELAGLHACDDAGRVARGPRDRFGLFLIGWLGGPDDYVTQHGHPRLRMRHGRVPVNEAMRDAWLRCMQAALDGEAVTGPVRAFLEARFAEVADFLRNTP
jgi:hemoglobin